MSPALEKERIDHQILNPIFSGTEPDRDTLAEYQIHLAAFFCISVPECLGRCVGKHPEKLWVKIPNYFCLSAYSGKKKDHTVKNVLLVNALLVILFLSDTHGGRTHDLRIAEATPYPLPAGSGLLQDLAFLSFTLPQVDILMPTKKPRGAELTLEQQLANQALPQRRLRI